MTENVENLMLEILRRLQSDMADVKSRLTSIEVQMASLGQQVGSLTTAVYGGYGQIDELRRRVERIERRLELHDDSH